MVQNIYAGLMPSTKVADLFFLRTLSDTLSTKAPIFDAIEDIVTLHEGSSKTDYTTHALYWCVHEM